jgi:hypothetical protein
MHSQLTRRHLLEFSTKLIPVLALSDICLAAPPPTAPAKKTLELETSSEGELLRASHREGSSLLEIKPSEMKTAQGFQRTLLFSKNSRPLLTYEGKTTRLDPNALGTYTFAATANAFKYTETIDGAGITIGQLRDAKRQPSIEAPKATVTVAYGERTWHGAYDFRTKALSGLEGAPALDKVLPRNLEQMFNSLVPALRYSIAYRGGRLADMGVRVPMMQTTHPLQMGSIDRGGLGEIDGPPDCVSICAILYWSIMALCDILTAGETAGLSLVACYELAMSVWIDCMLNC